MDLKETQDSKLSLKPSVLFLTFQNQVQSFFSFSLFCFVFFVLFLFLLFYFFIFVFLLITFSVNIFVCVCVCVLLCFFGFLKFLQSFLGVGIMFQDITTLLLDHKAFKDTVDIFVDRYRDMGISVVAGSLAFSLLNMYFISLYFSFVSISHFIHFFWLNNVLKIGKWMGFVIILCQKEVPFKYFMRFIFVF